MFAVLAHIAWTYLMHQYYDRRKVKIVGEDGRSLLLSQMLRREDCPLSIGIKRNLEAMTTIRNEVEHKVLGRGDLTFLPIFQACCLNFDKTISDLFGAAMSLQSELTFSLSLQRRPSNSSPTCRSMPFPSTFRRWMRACNKGLLKRSWPIWNTSLGWFTRWTAHRKAGRTSNSFIRIRRRKGNQQYPSEIQGGRRSLPL